MDLEQGQSYEGEERSRWLRTYLRDHTVGAEHAVQLLRALRDSHEGTLLGQFATDELQQIEKDFSLLEDLASRIGSDGLQVKALAAWFGLSSAA